MKKLSSTWSDLLGIQQAMISGYSLPASSSFWLVTACLLIALMRQENRPLDFVAKSNQEIVEVLLDRLR